MMVLDFFFFFSRIMSLMHHMTHTYWRTSYVLLPQKKKKGLNQGIGSATLFASFFLGYALAFWYGTKLVADDLEDGCTSDCATGVSFEAFGKGFSTGTGSPIDRLARGF